MTRVLNTVRISTIKNELYDNKKRNKVNFKLDREMIKVFVILNGHLGSMTNFVGLNAGRNNTVIKIMI